MAQTEDSHGHTHDSGSQSQHLRGHDRGYRPCRAGRRWDQRYCGDVAQPAGTHTIEGPLDAALGVAGMLEVIGAYTQPFDAVVVACFGDPGVDALRVLVRVPVIGIAAASFIQAAFLSQRFAIVTPAVRARPALRCRDRRHGDKAAVSRYLSDTTVSSGF